MSYNRLHGDSIRVYPDSMNWLFSRGLSRGEFDDKNTGAWDYNTGHDKYKLIDLNPTSPCSFNTSAGTTAHIMHQMDFQVTSSNPINFLKIMGHNADTAQVGFRVAYSTGAFTNPGDGTTVGGLGSGVTAVLNGTVSPESGQVLDEDIAVSETEWDVTDGTVFTVGELLYLKNGLDIEEVVKVTGIAGDTLTVDRAVLGADTTHDAADIIYRYNLIVPEGDGDTILVFTEIDDKRYWCIETVPIDGEMSATDLEIGSYQLGAYYSFPVAPDLNVKAGFMMDGVKTRTSPAGKDFTFAEYLSANDGVDTYAPYRRGTYFRRMVGKQFFDLTWAGMDDSNIYPQDMQAPDDSRVLLSDFIRKVGLNYLPFTLALDEDSGDESDYLWCKVNQKDFTTTQKAWQWSGFPLRFIQQF